MYAQCFCMTKNALNLDMKYVKNLKFSKRLNDNFKWILQDIKNHATRSANTNKGTFLDVYLNV